MGYGFCSVRGTVIDKNQLQIGIGLPQNRVKEPADQSFAVVAGNDNADQGILIHVRFLPFYKQSCRGASLSASGQLQCTVASFSQRSKASFQELQ